MSARFFCRRDPLGYFTIRYRDGGLLAQGSWSDMLAIIRAIHGRTIHSKPLLTSPKACETKYKENQ